MSCSNGGVQLYFDNREVVCSVKFKCGVCMLTKKCCKKYKRGKKPCKTCPKH